MDTIIENYHTKNIVRSHFIKGWRAVFSEGANTDVTRMGNYLFLFI